MAQSWHTQSELDTFLAPAPRFQEPLYSACCSRPRTSPLRTCLTSTPLGISEAALREASVLTRDEHHRLHGNGCVTRLHVKTEPRKHARQPRTERQSEAVSWIGSGTAPRWYTEGLPRKAPSSDPGGGACLCSQESHPHAKIRPSSLSQRRQRGRMCRRSRREGRETRRTRVPQDAPREIERLGAPLQCPETSDPRRSARPRERRCAASARQLGRAAIAADAARIRN
jgi:hypothetical protein